MKFIKYLSIALVLGSLLFIMSSDNSVQLKVSAQTSKTEKAKKKEMLGSDPVLNQYYSINPNSLTTIVDYATDIAISGDIAVVGAFTDDDAGSRAGAAYVYAKSGSSWGIQRKIYASDAAPEFKFGSSVAIDGDTIVIGSSGHRASGVDSGAAYVFTRSGSDWVERTRLIAPGLETRDKFGSSVGIDGNWIVIGAADAESSDPGSAYMYEGAGESWVYEGTLSGSLSEPGDYFGESVAISGSNVVVGAWRYDGDSGSSGIAYVFRLDRGAWTEVEVLEPEGASTVDLYGIDVDIDGNTIAIGAPGDDEVGSSGGAIYVYKSTSVTNWQLDEKLLPRATENPERLGYSVSIIGDFLVGGAPGTVPMESKGRISIFERSTRGWSSADSKRHTGAEFGDRFGFVTATNGIDIFASAPTTNRRGENSSSIFVFREVSDQFSQRQELFPRHARNFDEFGFDVAIEGDTAIIGMPGEDIRGKTNVGAVFILSKATGSWKQEHWLGGSTAEGRFGSSVALNGNRIAIGAPYDGTNGDSDGAVFVYERVNEGVWVQVGDIISGQDESRFGSEVSFIGDELLIGAPNDEQGGVRRGSVFRYELENNFWSRAQTLSNSGIDESDLFGSSISVGQNYVVVGAIGDEVLGDRSGSVHVYEIRPSGSLRLDQKLTASDGSEFDVFGASSGFSGDTLFVGAPSLTQGGEGAIYRFELTGFDWSEVEKIQPNTTSQFDNFGVTMAVDGDTLIVGNTLSDGREEQTGNARILKKQGPNWSFTHLLYPSVSGLMNTTAPNSQDAFASSLAIDGDEILIGSRLGNVLADNSSGRVVGGSAHFFTNPSNTFGGTPFDFDGDSKADISVFRRNLGEWWYLRSSDGIDGAFAFGTSTDVAVPADFTGDGIADFSFWRPSSGEWFVLRSDNTGFYSFPFGATGDVPAPGDFDGDGTDDAAVFRPSSGTWFILRSSNGQTDFVSFGANGDQPLVADYDGDGSDDVAVYKPTVGQFWQFRSDQGLRAYEFGQVGDTALVADFSGDGTDDIGVFRDGAWLILRSEDEGFFGFPFGAAGDIPAPADYDGDGTADPTVFRPTDTTWYSQQSTNGATFTPFGVSADEPVPSSYLEY